MNKRQLLKRLDRRARQRYGVSFTSSFLNDLIKDGLVSRSKRLANVGKQPVHFWGRNSYRRGLQIARLVSLGVRDRDAQRVFLFLKGYGQPVRLVRRPLLKEYISHGKKIAAAARSRYVDNTETIPPGQKSRLIKSLGPHDSCFAQAGHSLGDDLLVSAIRSAKQDALHEPDIEGLSERLVHWNQDSAGAARNVASLFAGMLMFDADPNDDGTDLDYIEKLVLEAPENAYLLAAECLRSLNFGDPTIRQVLFPGSSTESFERVARFVGRTVSDRPEVATMTFVVVLRLVVAATNDGKNAGLRHSNRAISH